MHYQRIGIICTSILLSTCVHAISDADLIEVTSKSQAKCVEYFTKKGAMFCSTKATDTSTPDANITNYEKQHIVFDDRTWKFAWGKKADDVTTIKYVPLGDNINDWKELVTSQYITNLPPNINPRSFAEIIVSDLKKKGLTPDVTYHQVTPDLVIFEFKIKAPANQIQDEIQIIRKKDDGFYFLDYAVKQADMGKENRDKWISNFKKSY